MNTNKLQLCDSTSVRATLEGAERGTSRGGLFWLLMPLAFSLLLANPALAAEQFAHADFTQPDFFPIMPWDPLHGWDGRAPDSKISGLETIAECGFNFAGFVTPEDLPR